MHAVDDRAVGLDGWEIEEGEPKPSVLAVLLLLEQHMHRRAFGELGEGDRHLDREVLLVRESRGRDAEVIVPADRHAAVRRLDSAMVEGRGDLVLRQIPERRLRRERRGKSDQEQG